MSARYEALQVLSRAQENLRDLLERALAEHRYGDVSEIARLAEGVSVLVDTAVGERSSEPTKVPAPGQPNADENSSRQEPSGRRATGRPSRKNDRYPLFEREGDKLVKVGWSKKDRREYEHRAPQASVATSAKAIFSASRGKDTFSMDDVLPVSVDGAELPSYQVYLTLAWLRSLGAVRRLGKDGYSVDDSGWDRPGIDALWSAVPERP